MKLRFHACSALIALVLATGARAAPSSDDQEACTPDVFRLCASAIPGEDAIVKCLNAKVAQLSPPCRAVIDPPKPARAKRRAHRA